MVTASVGFTLRHLFHAATSRRDGSVSKCVGVEGFGVCSHAATVHASDAARNT
jgi:hypothetical protein